MKVITGLHEHGPPVIIGLLDSVNIFAFIGEKTVPKGTEVVHSYLALGVSSIYHTDREDTSERSVLPDSGAKHGKV